MKGIQRLLAATDLSAPARYDAKRAALVARELGAGLALLHVISASPVDRLRRLLAEAPGAQVREAAARGEAAAPRGLPQGPGRRGFLAVVAAGTAAARAVAPAAKLVVLHAYEVPFEDRLRSSGLSPDAAMTLVLQGDPASLLVEQEQERDFDLFVVGKHGESTLESILLGNVTRHVLQASQGDVLVSLGAPLLADRAG